MKLQLATWPEIETWLNDRDDIVLPIGSTEQHGPNGLIGTDALCPEIIAGGLSEHGALIGPTISIGMAQHHLAFPGSITLRPTTLIALIRDVVGSLATQGFRRFFFLNGHGGNVATVHAAFSELWADHSLAGESSELDFKLVNWFDGARVRLLSKELFGDAEGSHATPSEVSLTWYAYPEAARDVPMDPERAPTGAIRDAHDYRERFPDGRIGSNPALASVEYGERLYRAGLEDAMDAWRKFVEA